MVRLSDHLAMTIAVELGRKSTKTNKQKGLKLKLYAKAKKNLAYTLEGTFLSNLIETLSHCLSQQILENVLGSDQIEISKKTTTNICTF